MRPAALHPNEEERLASLHNLDILDTEAEQQFDALIQLAANIADTPIALLSLVDKNRQWFKAKEGLNASETSRDIAFCSHAILDPENPLVVEDPLTNPRFKANPLVTQEPNIRFYAGFPVLSPSSHLPLGTLCVIHNQHHTLSDDQIKSLKILAQQVEHLFALRENQKNLISQQRKLEEAIEAKSQYLSAMSHEIRTPMNAILGAAQLLNSQTLTNENKTHISTILNSGTILLDLINNILDISKIDAGKKKPSYETTDLRQIISQIITVHHPHTIDKPELKILSRVSPDIPKFIDLDVSHTRQILLNLVSNACKYSHKGEIVITAMLKNSELILTVSDQGVGISKHQQKSIFEPFYQCTEDLNSMNGTGLGLSIVKNFTHFLGGSIRLVSAPGIGSEFIVSLPFKESTKKLTQQTTDTTPLQQFKDKTILIADDVAINLLITKTMLEKLRCSVLTATNGEELLEHLGDSNIDLVLTDVHMPVINGLDATVIWRKKDTSTPIIALTADATEDLSKKCNGIGINQILTKPINMIDLSNCLKTQLEKN